MKHLTTEEIINFVSIYKTDSESMDLADRVNMHIRNCDECLTKVRAFQMVYDELTRIGRVGEYKSFMYRIVSDAKIIDYEKRTIANISEQQNKQD